MAKQAGASKARLKVGFLMDPIEKINLETDTSFVIMMEAQKRGHRLFYFTPPDLWMEDGRPVARMSQAKVKWPASKTARHYSLSAPKDTPLDSLDLLFNRVDPPYSIDYVTLTQTLGLVRPPAVVVNRPRGVLLANEKIMAMHFADFMPPTLVTSDRARLRGFLARIGGRMVLKPLDGFGGEGVLLAEKGHVNLGALLDSMTENGKKQVVAQKYLPVDKAGDKRIFMLAGEPIGAVLRLPAKGDLRANLHSGGRAAKATLSEREIGLCKAVGPFLRREGLYLAGLDVIGGYLTELNVTSPTLVRQINRFDKTKLEERILDFCEYLCDTARGRAKKG